jgi:hypothetical protein
MSYHNGSVWPHDNAIFAAGLANYGLKDAVNQIITGLFEANPIGQHACFSNVDNFTPRALHQIDAGLFGQMVKLGLKVGSNGHGGYTSTLSAIRPQLSALKIPYKLLGIPRRRRRGQMQGRR